MRLPTALLATCLLVGLAPGVVADPPSGGDAPNDASSAVTVAPGSYAASLTTGDQDWYRLAVPATTRVQVAISGCSGLTLELYRGDGSTLLMSGGCTGNVHCVALANQVVYARVSGGTGTYTLTVSHTGASLDGFCSF